MRQAPGLPFAGLLPAGLLLAAAILAPLAAAQAVPEGVEFVPGGEPGILVSINGTDVTTAVSRSTALKVHPDTPIELTLALAAPPGKVWEMGEMRANVLLRGAESSGLGMSHPLDATIPHGYTVFINRTLDLAPLRPMGTGLFMMRVELDDENGTVLYAQDFQVHVQGNVLFSVAGATATLVTVATGYGLWSILNDLRELKKARDRHRAREKEKGKLARLADAAIALEDGLEGAMDVAGDSDQRAERLSRKRPLAWAATGLGLGAVSVSWAQFLGYVPVHLGTTLIVGMGTAAFFLTTAILAVVLAKRFKERRVVRVPVQGPPEPAAASAPAAMPGAEGAAPGEPGPEGPLEARHS